MKHSILFIISLTCAFATKAQHIVFIPKLGTSIHTLKGDDYYDYERKSQVGFAGGIGAEIGLSKENRFALQPELLFVTKGAKFIDTPKDGFVRGDDVYKLNYLEIPVLLKVSTRPNKVTFFANAGPSLAIGIGGKFKFIDVNKNTTSLPIVFKNTTDINDVNINPRIDYGFQLGAGMNYKIGTFKMVFETRYGLGLNEIENKSRLGIKMVNRFLLVIVGVLIPLTKNK